MEQTILLNFEIDQSKAIRDYERLEKVIMDNKKAQQDLTAAYKAQNITQEEYIAEQARLSGNLSKETAQRNTLKKVIEAETGSLNAEKAALASLIQQRNSLNRTTDAGIKRFDQLNKEIEALTDSLKKAEQGGGNFQRNVGNYPELLKDISSQVSVAGVNLGSLATQFSTVAGAAGAVVGVLSALAGAYLASSEGARDLQFAQDKMKATNQILINDLVKLAGSPGGGGGNGVLSQLTDAAYAAAAAQLGLLGYMIDVQRQANITATALENLRDLEISLAFAAGDAKNDERRAEVLRRIRDDESQVIDDRITASQQIDGILENSKQRTITVLNAEREAIKKSVVDYDLNREAQLKVAQITAEIADKEEEITGKLTENVTARRALIKLQQEQLFLLEQEIREANKPSVDTSAQAPGGNQLSDPAIAASDARISQYTKELEAVEMTEAQKQEYYRRGAAYKKQIDDISNEVYLSTLSSTFGSVASLFKQNSTEYKLFASAEAIIATYSGATKAYDALASIPYAGPALGAAAAAAAVIAGLANVAQINGVQFAEGGYTGPGHKYQPAGVVHAGEVVWNQRDVAAVGGPRAADAMRPTFGGAVSRGTYATGGMVTAAPPTSQITRPVDQQMMLMDMVKNIPAGEVSVKEITRLQRRIQARERTAKSA